MSTETNKAIVSRLYEEVMNQNKSSIVDELVAPNYVNRNFPLLAPGGDGFRQVIDMFRMAFPDLQIIIEDEIAQDDKVVTRGYFTGTNQGEFQGMPPTGKQVKTSYIEISRIENGQLVENWIQMDNLGMLQQLGVIPPMG